MRVLFGETLKKYNKLFPRGTCCSEGFGCEPLSLLEAIALGFVIYLAFSCVGAKRCIENPLLKMDDRVGCVIMCVLHLVIRCGEYLTTFVRTRATMLPINQQCKVQSLLKDAKTNISLKGRSLPDGEETWHLFANWVPIANSLRLTPHVTTIVEDMGKLLTAIYQCTYDPFVHGCAHIAKRFQSSVCP